jgi:hypothetical protein
MFTFNLQRFCGSKQTTESNSTSTVKKWTGENATMANGLISNLKQNITSKNPYQDALSAYNNGTFSTGVNPLQTADYNRNMALMGSSAINDYASGNNLDLSKNKTFQKTLASGVDTLTDAFGVSLDSVNGAYQRGGIGDSSMKYRKNQRMLENQGKAVGDYITTATSNEEDKQIQKMLQANSLLNQAGQAGYNYQTATENSKNNSLSNFAKLYSLDASNNSQLMQLLQLIAEPTTTTTGNSTTSKNGGLADIASLAGVFF